MRDIEIKRLDRKEIYTIKNYLNQGVFLLFYSFVKYLSFPLSNYLRYFLLKMFSKKIESTYISDGVTFWFPDRISVGKNSSLNQGDILDGTGRISIGNNVRIAAYVTINTADHEFRIKDTPISKQGYIVGEVIIEDDVWIGASVVINKGVKIGRGSIIGSGSVVVKDIPEYSIAVGNPCKMIKKRV
jgi:acetyltransferase-like isoleucine patch superfamily enzyme